MAKLHVANLKKVPVHPQKMPVANYEGKFATGMKKCNGKKKHCFPYLRPLPKVKVGGGGGGRIGDTSKAKFPRGMYLYENLSKPRSYQRKASRQKSSTYLYVWFCSHEISFRSSFWVIPRISFFLFRFAPRTAKLA